MKISRRTDYALRAMIHLALRKDGGLSSIAEISAAENTPKEFTAKVLKELCRTGLIRSRLGPRGGYRLARPADQVTVLEVMEALDGPLAINECLAEPSICGQTSGCRMHALFRRVNTQMREILNNATISEIAHSDRYLHLTETPATGGEADGASVMPEPFSPSADDQAPDR